MSRDHAISRAVARVRRAASELSIAEAELAGLLGRHPFESEHDDDAEQTAMAERLTARAAELGIVAGADGRFSAINAAALVGRSVRTLARWRESGELPATNLRGKPRFALADLAAALLGDPDAA